MQAGSAPVARAAQAPWAALLACGWIAGVAWQLQEAELAPPQAVAALAIVALLAAAAAWRWRRRWVGALLLMAAMAALAYASTTQRAAARLADALPAALEGRDIVVTGVIAELPQVGPTGTRFVFETETDPDPPTLLGQPVHIPARLALGWYRSGDEDPAISGPGEDLRAGQRWRLTVRLKQPHGTLNPHGYDLELWLFEQGIAASGTVRAGPGDVKLDESVAHPVERLRQTLRDAIDTRVGDATAAGVLAALAVGDQAAIDRSGWDLFRDTGVAHLMSISGLHVTMFAWLAGALVSRLWRLQPRWLLACPAPQAARLGGWAAAAAYSLLAGWGVPSQRTVWMIGVVVLLRANGARWPLHAVLLAAALAVVLFDPWALLQPGFWLSFVAVALLVAADPAQAARPARAPAGLRSRLAAELRGGLRTQVVATIGLAPLTLLFFQQLSLVGFFANLVAIPLVTLVVTPLALLGVLLPPLWLLDSWVVHALMAFLRMLAAWPLAVWQAAAAPPWAVASGLLAGALAVLPLPWRLRLLALPLALPLLAPPVARPAPGQFELVAADIGQGTAVLVRTREHLLLFDTGPQYAPGSDAGNRVLLPLLRARGEHRIDLLMLSHRDADHVGGAASVIAAMPVAMLSSSLGADHPLLAHGPPHRRCDAGQSWDWDGVRFEVLHPLPGDHALALKANAVSCVLHVRGRQAAALLTGDIEAPQEAALVQRARAALASDVLVVPHHGSRTSSTPAFIDAVQPHVAVVQAAYRSRFGHPAPDVVARYAERGIAVVRSDRCGAWTLAGDGSMRCERVTARRYWHHRVPGDVQTAP